MKTNYVLIDYENVQPEAMAGLCEDHFKVLVFVGENQSKVTFEVASAGTALSEPKLSTRAVRSRESTPSAEKTTAFSALRSCSAVVSVARACATGIADTALSALVSKAAVATFAA